MKRDILLVAVIQVAVLLPCYGHSPQPQQVDSPKTTNNDIPHDHRFFLHEIFSKYGHNGVMSYEGFEHLLANLGLGRLAFDKEHSVALHRVNGSFQEVHDELELHEHHHDEYDDMERERRSVGHDEGDVDIALERLAEEHDEDATLSIKPVPPPRKCLSPQDILVTFGLEPYHSVMISPVRFLHMCPVIVYELDQRSCYEEHPEREATSNDSPWMQATISVSLISVIGLLGVLIVPMVQKSFYNHLLNFLVGLAVGTLCGDALLHLLPHALVSHNSFDSHNTIVLRASMAFLTLITFYFMEKIIHHFKSSDNSTEENEIPNRTSPGTSQQSGGHDEGINKEAETRVMLESPSHGHSHALKGKSDSIKSVAWMVIMGDGLHNLTDGLAIGAAFSGDSIAGFATALAVFCHELPHELGDFAILIKSGMSVRKALYYNVVSSILSFIGMGFGVWIGKIGAAALWIYAATAGTFLYIALADLIPEMNLYSQQSKSILGVILPMAGMITGGLIMLIIALYEHSLHSLFS